MKSWGWGQPPHGEGTGVEHEGGLRKEQDEAGTSCAKVQRVLKELWGHVKGTQRQLKWGPNGQAGDNTLLRWITVTFVTFE